MHIIFTSKFHGDFFAFIGPAPDCQGFIALQDGLNSIWGLAPNEVLFVGDRSDVDATGAAAAGMHCAIVGRADAPGRPIQYGTTDQFLEFLGPPPGPGRRDRPPARCDRTGRGPNTDTLRPHRRRTRTGYDR